MKKVLLIVVLTLLTACSTKSELDKILEENNYIIIDVRTSLEYESGHIKDSINIPYDNLTDSFDKNKTILVYCKSGRRSSIAYDTLTTMGSKVYDLGAYENIDLPKEK